MMKMKWYKQKIYHQVIHVHTKLLFNPVLANIASKQVSIEWTTILLTFQTFLRSAQFPRLHPVVAEEPKGILTRHGHLTKIK
jgi:hypothetical protein